MTFLRTIPFFIITTNGQRTVWKEERTNGGLTSAGALELPTGYSWDFDEPRLGRALNAVDYLSLKLLNNLLNA